MREPFLHFRRQVSFPPLLQFYLMGLRKILGKCLIHFNRELAAQDNRIHLVIAQEAPVVHVGGTDRRPDTVNDRSFRMQQGCLLYTSDAADE